jgi:bacterioferritin
MQGDKKVIEHLNLVLGNELIGINQYFLHARMFKNWGFGELNDKAYKKSIKDMKQADRLIERVLFLEGIPNLQKLGKLMIGEHPKEMLECDLNLEISSLEALRTAIAICESTSDYVSRDILREILAYEEEYLDWLETQLALIEQISIENYLQSMMDE